MLLSWCTKLREWIVLKSSDNLCMHCLNKWHGCSIRISMEWTHFQLKGLECLDSFHACCANIEAIIDGFHLKCLKCCFTSSFTILSVSVGKMTEGVVVSAIASKQEGCGSCLRLGHFCVEFVCFLRGCIVFFPLDTKQERGWIDGKIMFIWQPTHRFYADWLSWLYTAIATFPPN